MRLKRSEGWGIALRSWKNSLSAKVFWGVMAALTACGFLLYGLVMVMLPRQYTVLASARLEEAVSRLAAEADGGAYAPACEAISDFCLKNRTTAMLTLPEETVVFGGETVEDEAENTSSLSMVLRFSDRAGGVLTVLSSASAAGEITAAFLKMLPIAAGLILLLSALSAWLCSRRLVRPVLEISRVSSRMAQMDMTWHCETKRTDELGTLAKSLNTLSQKLTRAMGELKDANARLRADIALSRTLEKQRRDFFAAASHELKTPLTVLKGQLESMALGIGDYKNHEKYLPQALQEAENMERLIQEILTITKMQSGLPEASFSVEPLAPLLHACLDELRPLAEAKGISMEADADEAVRARVNRGLFQKALSNVLSNAVRYSPEGERVVAVLTEDALTVENTGASIAEEDLPQLFTPFYRSDPSRSRRSGGSGLGLSIVKEALDLHGFACKVENTENAVRFTLFLNQNKTG